MIGDNDEWKSDNEDSNAIKGPSFITHSYEEGNSNPVNSNFIANFMGYL